MIVSSPVGEYADSPSVVLKPQKSSHLRVLNLQIDGVDICGLVLFTSVEPRLDVHLLYRQPDERGGIILTYDTLAKLGDSMYIEAQSQITHGYGWMTVYCLGRSAFASLMRPRDCVISVFNSDYHKDFSVSRSLGLLTAESTSFRTDIHAVFRRCTLVFTMYKPVCTVEDAEEELIRFKTVGARAAPSIAIRLGPMGAEAVGRVAMNIPFTIRHGPSSYSQREEQGVYRLVYLNPKTRVSVTCADHKLDAAAYSMSGTGPRVYLRSDDCFSNLHAVSDPPQSERWMVHDDVDAVYQLVVSGPSYTVLSEPQVGVISYSLEMRYPLPRSTELLIHKRGLAFVPRD